MNELIHSHYLSLLQMAKHHIEQYEKLRMVIIEMVVQFDLEAEPDWLVDAHDITFFGQPATTTKDLAPTNGTPLPGSLTDKQKDLLDDLRRLAGELKRTPSGKDLNACPYTKSRYVYTYHFGRMRTAQRLAGLVPNKQGKQTSPAS